MLPQGETLQHNQTLLPIYDNNQLHIVVPSTIAIATASPPTVPQQQNPFPHQQPSTIQQAQQQQQQQQQQPQQQQQQQQEHQQNNRAQNSE